jgi:hypothetical protein
MNGLFENARFGMGFDLHVLGQAAGTFWTSSSIFILGWT